MSNLFSEDPWSSGWADKSDPPFPAQGFGSNYMAASQTSDFNFDESKLPASFKQIYNKYNDDLSTANDLERLVLDKLVDAQVLSSYQRTRIVNAIFDQNLLPLSVAHNLFQALGLLALELDMEGSGDFVTLQFKIADLPEFAPSVLDTILAEASDPLSDQLAATTLEDDWKAERPDPVLEDHSGIQQGGEDPAAFSELSAYINGIRDSFKPLVNSNDTVHIKEVPEKEGLLFKHINYVITHEVHLGLNSPAGPKKVLRRYSDFVWLLEYLLEKFPFRVIPGLPPKKFTVGATPDTQFLQRRRRGLYRFLNQLVRHPVLRSEPVVVTFLNVPTDLTSWRKQAKIDYSLEFKGNKISGQFVNKIWPAINEEFLKQWKEAESKILSVIELWTKIVILVERYERRQQQIAYDNNKYAQIIGKFSDVNGVLYPHGDGKESTLSALNRDDTNAINNSLHAISDFFTNSNKLIIDDSYLVNTKVLEKFRNYLDYLYSLHELFERSKKLSVNSIPQLQTRIRDNEARYTKMSSEDADVRGSEVAKLKQQIINDKQEMFQQLNRDWLIKECCLQEFLMFQETQYLLSELWVEWCKGRNKYQLRHSELHEDLDKLVTTDMPLSR